MKSVDVPMTFDEAQELRKRLLMVGNDLMVESDQQRLR